MYNNLINFNPNECTLTDSLSCGLSELSTPERKFNYAKGFLLGNPHNVDDLEELKSYLPLNDYIQIIMQNWKYYTNNEKNHITDILKNILTTAPLCTETAKEAKIIFSFFEMLAAENPFEPSYSYLLKLYAPRAAELLSSHRFRIFTDLSSYYCLNNAASDEEYCKSIKKLHSMLNHTKNADSLRDYSYLEALLIQRLSLKTYYGKIITYDIVNEIFQHCISHYPNHSYRDYAYPYRDDLVFEELIISNHCPEIVRLFNDPVNHFSAYFIQRLMRYANQEATDAYYSKAADPIVGNNPDFCRKSFKPQREQDLFATKIPMYIETEASQVTENLSRQPHPHKNYYYN